MSTTATRVIDCDLIDAASARFGDLFELGGLA